MIRVLLADDHAVVRQGLRTFLDLQDDIEVVAEAGDGEAALDAAARTDPDVILLDLVMPRLDGVGTLKRLQESSARGCSCSRASATTTSCSPPCARAPPATCSRTSSPPNSCARSAPHTRAPPRALAGDRHPHRRGDRPRRRPERRRQELDHADDRLRLGPSAGELRVLGLDPRTDGPAIRARLGVVPQEDNLDTELSVRDNLIIYGRYFGIASPVAPGAGGRSCSTSCS